MLSTSPQETRSGQSRQGYLQQSKVPVISENSCMFRTTLRVYHPGLRILQFCVFRFSLARSLKLDKIARKLLFFLLFLPPVCQNTTRQAFA